MGWSPFEYYTSSPCEFYYACKGYFDKEESDMLIQRKVAQVMWAQYGKPADFENFWPLPSGVKEQDKKVWGSKEDAAALRAQIEKAHGIKLG